VTRHGNSDDRAEQIEIEIEIGGGLRSYSAGGRDLVDGYGPREMRSSGRGQVLIPWPNRPQDGSCLASK
jgi:galactose mutarotase-like enzyme